jgi:membrane protein YqaA with SNARE-associated domain
MHWLAFVLLASKKSTLRWVIHLGGPGLILLGIADNSLIPLPGSMDVVTILLAAHHREPWPYYAFMATVGALIGGYLTYRMARKGGKETLEKRFSARKVKKVYAIFERWGFAAVAIPATLPPRKPLKNRIGQQRNSKPRSLRALWRRTQSLWMSWTPAWVTRSNRDGPAQHFQDSPRMSLRKASSFAAQVFTSP